MTIEEKRQAILEAVTSGKVTGKQLEPSRKGATISKLKSGKPVADKTIEKLYASLLELTSDNNESNKPDNNDNNESNKPDNNDNNESNKPDNKGEVETMQAMLTAMRQEMASMRQEMASMRQEIETLKSNKPDNNESNKPDNNESNKPDNNDNNESNKPDGLRVLGFSLRYQKITVKGKVYWAWYALRRFNGKLSRVYVGNDSLQAESKIRAYCEKNCIELR